MRKLLFMVMAALLLPLTDMKAQTFATLWKQYEEAEEKDLPKTQLSVLGKIAEKAEREKAYGQLLAASLRQVAVETRISPDSLKKGIAQLEQKAQSTTDPVLAAVWANVLGRVFRESYYTLENHLQRSREYYDRSLSNPALLAGERTAGYKPAVVEEVDSKAFGNDLLHMMAIEADRWDLLRDYYASVGNRKACDFLALRDSAEAAISRVERLICDDKVPARMKIDEIDKAVAQWGSYSRMSVLRNARMDLIRPMFRMRAEKRVMLPNRQYTLPVTVRNLRQLTLTVSKVAVGGDTRLNPNEKSDYAKLRKLLVAGSQTTQTKRYDAAEYETVEDSFVVDQLPVGAYLVELASDNKEIETERALVFVTDLYVLAEELPSKQMLYAVVSATTGQPVAGATVVLSLSGGYGKKATTERLKTDSRGEVIYNYGDRQPSDVTALTDGDNYLPSSRLWGRYHYYEPRLEQDRANLYTDRRLYRPGQKVQVAMLLFHNSKGLQTKAVAGRRVTLTLRDANYKEVEKAEVVTDNYGQANAAFLLPESGLTGQFSIQSDAGGGSTYFSVEEYKRPTFEVSFDKVEQEYHFGDTIVVTGRAKTYSGIPVQGAKVCSQVMRRQARWWWHQNYESDALLATDTLVTDTDGKFEVRVPLLPPETRGTSFYQFEVAAVVTDQGGESHEGSLMLPLGTRATAFTCELPERSERSKLKVMRFGYQNAAGTEIEGQVRYRFDDGEEQTVAANTMVSLENVDLASGKHVLTAICGTDSLRKEFTVFSLSDTTPVEQTHDWFYQSATVFPRDGGPVYIQVGSSDQDQHILYTILSGGKVVERGVIDQSNALTTRAFEWCEEYGSGLCLTYAWVKEGIMYSHSTTIARPLPDKTLTMNWETFRDRLEPGQKEEWRLTVARPDGTPAAAQLMATLYDKSLDQIRRHQWSFDPLLSQNLPSANWQGSSFGGASFYGVAPIRHLTVSELLFSHYDDDLFRFVAPHVFPTSKGFVVRKGMRMAKSAAVRSEAVEEVAEVGAALNMSAVSRAADEDIKVFDVVEQAPAFPADGGESEVQLRSEFAETALFCPALESNGNGRVCIRFTLPESVTTWKFMGLAHDVEMNYGVIEGEAVAQKRVMIQPNMPRFLRQDDRATLSARIFNQSEKTVKGTARLQLIDPETNRVVLDQQQRYELGARQTGAASFGIDLTQLAARLREIKPIYICRVTAEGKGYSDGEQHYLPILPNKEWVTTTVPFTLNEAGVKNVDLKPLFPKTGEQQRLTVEYTQNPQWLMIQALPSVSNPREDNAISLATAYYANTLANKMLHSSEAIRKTILAWKQEEGSEQSLMSALQKDADLKTLVLEETPWVLEAEQEESQKRQLVNFFDESAIRLRLADQVDKLRLLQNPDGSWCWWKGMPGSMYMTTTVAETMVRLNLMAGTQQNTRKMLDAAFRFMGREIADEVKNMKKWEREGAKNIRPSETAIHYLYLRALDGSKPTASQQADIDYLVKSLAKQTADLSIYGKAVSAIVLARNGKAQKAKEYLESIRQYSVYTEEMGRYFDTRKALYSWRDYKIPTEVAAIEAIRLLEPDDRQTVTEMQRWLLQSKRTQAWDTPINTVNAVYAFFDGNPRNNTLRYGNDNGNGKAVQCSLDGRTLRLPQGTAGIGYVKVSEQVANPKSLTLRKTDDGTSWGAVYAQCLVPAEDVESAASGLRLTVEVLGGESLKVGDKVTVRLTIEAERDYDFVQVEEKRAACLEPVSQLSGYHRGCYRSPRDNATRYYFDKLAKGKHVIETEYFVDRPGDYQTGAATVQCAYSPEYTGRASARTIHVK